METKTTETEVQPKTTPKKKVVVPPKTKAEPAKKVPVKKQNKPVNLEDHVRIAVRSNQYGTLVYINSRTRERILWRGINDIQEMTVEDIRDMRATARRFFEEPWVEIEEVVSSGYEDVTKEDIINALGLARYYSQRSRPERLSDALEWDIATIEAEAEKMTQSTRENLSLAVVEAVRTGELNELDKIKAWEKALDTEIL